MAHTATVQPDASPPPVYTEQPAGPSAQAAVFQPQPGYPAQVEMPGYPQKEGYPAQQPAYPGPHPLAAQPGYPPQTVQHIQQTSTVLMQQPTTQAIIIQTPPRPSSWLGLSIFTFLCCGWVFGLIAVIFSCMVDSAYDRGDYEEARRNSNIAKWLNIVAILSGVGITVYVIVYFTVLIHRVATSN